MGSVTTDYFSNAVLNLKDSLRYYALSLTHDGHDANDLVQETLLKAFMNRHRFAQNTNLQAWLYTIMKNVFINNYRRAAKAKTILDHSTNTYYINLPQNAKSAEPDSSLAFKEISNTIERMDNDYKIPFSMYFEGYKYKEIADDLNLPIGTVKSRIFLARKQLMEALADYAG